MRVKRAPLLGAMIIILLITIFYTNKNTEVKEVNKQLVTNEQTVISTNTDAESIDVDNENTDTIIPTPNQEVIPNDNTSLGSFRISAYCSCTKCCGKSDGVTASGTKATPNQTISVDPKVIPLGSKVIIDGHTYIAEDTGGAIKGNCIDLYFGSHEEALNWGVQYRDVTIVK